MLRFAKVVYPYWKERRVERGGHRVIPILNVSALPIRSSYGAHSFAAIVRRVRREE